MRNSLTETLTLAQLQKPRRAVSYTKKDPKELKSKIAVSLAAHEKFSNTVSANNFMSKAPTKRSSLTAESRVLEEKISRPPEQLVVEYDAYDLRSSFSRLHAQKSVKMPFSSRFEPIKDTPGVGDYRIDVERRVSTPSLASLASRFESDEERLARELHRMKYQIPYDRNIGPETYQGAPAKPQGTTASICCGERFVRNIVLEKHMEPGIGLTPRADLTKLHGGTFSESGHTLDSDKYTI